MILGITGSFGAGKSTVREEFSLLGWYFFDADKVCHDIYASPTGEFFNRITACWGRNIICQWIYKPLLCIVVATVLCRGWFSLFPLPFSGGLCILLHCLTTGGLYFLLLLLVRALEKEDLRWIGSLFQRKERDL